jgi:uncharacterized Zn-finger protein
MNVVIKLLVLGLLFACGLQESMCAAERRQQRSAAEEKAGVKCDQCEEVFKYPCFLKIHKQEKHGAEKPHKCGMDGCQKAFIRPAELRIHQRIHTGDKPFGCGICNSFFAQKGSLKRHEATHSDERKFICHCGAAFLRNESLKSHQKIHFGEKNYICDHCGNAFIQKSHLTRHIRLVHGEKEHECDECGAYFAESSTLTRHKKEHEQGLLPRAEHLVAVDDDSDDEYEDVGGGDSDEWLCTTCNRNFSSKSNLAKHQRAHTGVKRYSCIHCGKKLSTGSIQRQHELICPILKARKLAEGCDDIDAPAVQQPSATKQRALLKRRRIWLESDTDADDTEEDLVAAAHIIANQVPAVQDDIDLLAAVAANAVPAIIPAGSVSASCPTVLSGYDGPIILGGTHVCAVEGNRSAGIVTTQIPESGLEPEPRAVDEVFDHAHSVEPERNNGIDLLEAPIVNVLPVDVPAPAPFMISRDAVARTNDQEIVSIHAEADGDNDDVFVDVDTVDNSPQMPVLAAVDEIIDHVAPVNEAVVDNGRSPSIPLSSISPLASPLLGDIDLPEGAFSSVSPDTEDVPTEQTEQREIPQLAIDSLSYYAEPALEPQPETHFNAFTSVGNALPQPQLYPLLHRPIPQRPAIPDLRIPERVGLGVPVALSIDTRALMQIQNSRMLVQQPLPDFGVFSPEDLVCLPTTAEEWETFFD